MLFQELLDFQEALTQEDQPGIADEPRQNLDDDNAGIYATVEDRRLAEAAPFNNELDIPLLGEGMQIDLEAPEDRAMPAGEDGGIHGQLNGANLNGGNRPVGPFPIFDDANPPVNLPLPNVPPPTVDGVIERVTPPLAERNQEVQRHNCPICTQPENHANRMAYAGETTWMIRKCNYFNCNWCASTHKYGRTGDYARHVRKCHPQLNIRVNRGRLRRGESKIFFTHAHAPPARAAPGPRQMTIRHYFGPHE